MSDKGQKGEKEKPKRKDEKQKRSAALRRVLEAADVTAAELFNPEHSVAPVDDSQLPQADDVDVELFKDEGFVKTLTETLKAAFSEEGARKHGQQDGAGRLFPDEETGEEVVDVGEEPADDRDNRDRDDGDRDEGDRDEPVADSSSSESEDDDITMAGTQKTKAVMPSFSGEGEDLVVAEAVVTFLEKFEEYCQAAKVENDKKVATAAQCFKDGSPADVWYRGHKRQTQAGAAPFAEWTANNGAGLREQLLERFGRELTPDMRATQMSTLQQKKDEKVRTFADRVVLFQSAVDTQRKRDIAGIPDLTVTTLANQEKVLHFLAGLREDIKAQVKATVAIMKLTDWAAVRTVAEQVEDSQKREETPKEASSAGGTNAVDEGGVAPVNPGGWRGRGGGGGRGGFRGGRGGGGNFPRAAWRDKPTNRPGWVPIRGLPWDMCAVCALYGHEARHCTTPLDQQDWANAITSLNLQRPAGRGRGGGRGGGGRGGGQQNQQQQQPQQQPQQQQQQQSPQQFRPFQTYTVWAPQQQPPVGPTPPPQSPFGSAAAAAAGQFASGGQSQPPGGAFNVDHGGYDDFPDFI